jgi:type VI protein secretion system component Hcp
VKILFNNKRGDQTMFLHFSGRTRAVILAAVLYWGPGGFGQTARPDRDNGATIITVAIDGLACGSTAQGSFQASDFGIAVSTTSGSGGAGAGKTIFTDLAVLKSADSCSLPLFLLAANGPVIKRVVLTEGGRNGAPDLTITLENAQIVSLSLRSSESSTDPAETLDLSYTAVTIADGAGHTTGRIVRDSGSVPFSPFVSPRPSAEI